MSSFVLDASVAIAWCFEDESTPASRALLASLPEGSAVVPPLWHCEVANALLTAERRGRIDAPSAAHFLRLLERLPIHTDSESTGHAFGATQQMARTHALTAYDAAYLELAHRLALPLATRDEALAQAARAAGIRLLPA